LNKVIKLASILAARPYLSAMAFHRVAAAVEHVSVLACLDCLTVVDIGANRGQFALVARRCFPQAHIVSFEPLPVPTECFRQMLGKDPRVTVHQAAVGDASGDATIHIPEEDDSSSLFPITALQSALFPGTAEVRTQTVRIGRLSEFIDAQSIEPPALLKLDVQGYELEVLRGCEELIDRFLYAYVECSFVELYEGQALADEVIGWLREHGFRLRGVHNAVYDRHGQAIQADFLFIK
jgi:FkbM family methyltransferase